MMESDAIARYYGLEKKQMIKITYNSEMTGSFVTYRVVKWSTWRSKLVSYFGWLNVFDSCTNFTVCTFLATSTFGLLFCDLTASASFAKSLIYPCCAIIYRHSHIDFWIVILWMCSLFSSPLTLSCTCVTLLNVYVCKQGAGCI